ncbi:MAG: alpha/beta hydrolase [Pseudomonadota bacterium]
MQAFLFPALVAALLTLSANAAPASERLTGVDSFETEITVSDGAVLKATITLPAGDASPRHPLLFAQWVSCGELEFPEDSRSILAALARESGLALVRVERSALRGGPDCSALDFDTELEHYKDAFGALLENEHLDASRLYFYGSSLGSNTAPLLAAAFARAGHSVAGVMVQGGGGYTYLERMLEFERNYLERQPGKFSPTERHEQFLLRNRFHYEYLVNGRHPDEIASDGDDMRQVRGDILGLAENDHYGRPFAWHQQLARRNFLEAWAAVNAPVLVIFNEYDQFEARHGHRLIVDTVNRLRPGSATYVERQGIGHSNRRYRDIESAYAFADGVPENRETANIMLDWLDGIGVDTRP